MLLKKPLFFFYLFCYSLNCASAQNIAQEEMQRILSTLASDQMLGRGNGSKGNELAGEFIADEFKKIGLEYYADLDTYFQKFKVGFNANKGDFQNIVGILPGKSKKEEFIIFSAHYDHIGILEPEKGDSIANGADDDASGVTAVISLAKYFKAKGGNERTLVFVAFTAEEIGGYGSRHFAEQIEAEKYIAGINIEMIGKISKFGRKAAFITGFEKSDLGKMLQKNVQNLDFQFKPDPYPEQNLFYRSDNARFAQQGIPAHTLSSVQIDKDLYYHSVDDEVETLDLENMTTIIQAIALAVEGLVSGKDTPSRIKD